jgi:hypothetical protein
VLFRSGEDNRAPRNAIATVGLFFRPRILHYEFRIFRRLNVIFVVAHDADFCLWQSGLYQLRYFNWFHGSIFLEVSTRREV